MKNFIFSCFLIAFVSAIVISCQNDNNLNEHDFSRVSEVTPTYNADLYGPKVKLRAQDQNTCECQATTCSTSKTCTAPSSCSCDCTTGRYGGKCSCTPCQMGGIVIPGDTDIYMTVSQFNLWSDFQSILLTSNSPAAQSARQFQLDALSALVSDSYDDFGLAKDNLISILPQLPLSVKNLINDFYDNHNLLDTRL